MSDVEFVGESAAELQRLLAERRYLAEAALSLDGYERWGNGSDPKFEAHIASLGNIGQRKVDLVDRFAAGIAALRETDPASVERLSGAHIALLQRCITDAADDDSTAVFVAKGEIEGWQALASGEADRVEQNCYYIRYEPTLYQKLFGYQSGWPIRA